MFKEFDLDKNDLRDFPERLEALLKRHSERIEEIVRSDRHDYDTTVGAMQDMDEEREVFFTPLSHLNSVDNCEETQKAYEACLPLLSRFHSEVTQNEALYGILKRLESENPQRRRVLQNETRDFRLAGAELSDEEKKRLEKIDMELSELSNTFSQNLLEATNSWEMVIENQEDVEGIPESDLKSAHFTENGMDKWRFTLQMPSYIAYMTYGPNRELREKIYRAYNTRAPENSTVIDRILELRFEKAGLLGYENYSEYALQSRDADSQESVLGFLYELLRPSIAQAGEELRRLREFARQLDGIDNLASYDTAYYAEKLKKELYDFDERDTKAYFELQSVLVGLLEIVSELFGIEFKASETSVWHDSVRVYDLYNQGSLSGRIYFDLEARASKRGGAWMHDWESGFVDTHGRRHLPSAFVIANFPPTDDENPSLLRHDDVVTLFHEMGHAIHHLFSTREERSISGINGVAWDAIEFPSQFLENFAYEKSILRRLGKHYKNTETIPDMLLDKIKASKNFQAGMGMCRQIEFALFDFKLHQKIHRAEEVQDLIESVREECSVLKPPSYNRFQHGFAHIFSGGYAAGYYSYKWAEVMSADAFFECVDEDGSFRKDKALGYLKWILQRGGEEDMSSLYRRWLGREADTGALLKLYDIAADAG